MYGVQENPQSEIKICESLVFLWFKDRRWKVITKEVSINKKETLGLSPEVFT